MNDIAKEAYDKASMLKDINDRKQIIQDYQRTGHLDRDNAIKKIQELRSSDVDVAVATSARLAVSSTPFVFIPDQGIIAELQMQINVLEMKLSRNQQ